MPDPVLDTALAYAAAGFPVLPIRLNKVGKKMPLLKEWQRGAVVTGVRTRLLDVDIKTVNGMKAERLA